jgi:hypothetical protein
MNEVQKADPAARRQAVLVIIFGTAVGALLIAGFEHFREPFLEWLSSEPAETVRRAKLAAYVSAFVLSAPVIAFAIYLWLLGAKVLRAQRFPPPGLRVIRDTPVIGGRGAVMRGHVIQVLAVCLGVSAALLCLSFWWVARTISERAA